jgi:hypothetical protein
MLAQVRKRAPRLFFRRAAAALAVAVVGIFGILVESGRRGLDLEMRRAEAELLNSFEFYSQFLRNVRSVTQRYDMLLAGEQGPLAHGLSQAGQENIEALMLQSSFALGQEYFFLRGVNGETRVEIRRGAIQSTPSPLSIRGEEEFPSLSDVFLSRSCRINGIVHYCLIDIPNRREFVSPRLRTYSLVALTLPEAILTSRYKSQARAWPLLRPELFLRVDGQDASLTYGAGDIDFLVVGGCTPWRTREAIKRTITAGTSR